MSITVELRTRSRVRTEYCVALSAKRANRPRLIIGAAKRTPAAFRTERRDIIETNGQSSIAGQECSGPRVTAGIAQSV